ncbi:hypothetical protein J5N97_009367 [Dioscorea zingiberensis]|uniref:Uncharacterized protein n=1 Tax=Dioscorea zingiberensis TaxID=325984 RepID=A0A9D5CY35_9LILI|nr:hypothetical protein J5N97_009367 [Dioscorea zingiberensis]
MATEEERQRLIPAPRRSSILRVLAGRRIPWKRRKASSVQLGKRRVWWRRGGRLLFGVLRRIKLRFLVSKYQRVVKKLSDMYSWMLKDLAEGSAAMDAVQARILMETYFAIPIMPVSLTRTGRKRLDLVMIGGVLMSISQRFIVLL